MSFFVLSPGLVQATAPTIHSMICPIHIDIISWVSGRWCPMPPGLILFFLFKVGLVGVGLHDILEAFGLAALDD